MTLMIYQISGSRKIGVIGNVLPLKDRWRQQFKLEFPISNLSFYDKTKTGKVTFP